MTAEAASLQPGASETGALQQKLLDRQNPDGSWGFQGQTSWTEPTAFALLALTGSGNDGACDRAAQWLKQSQRDDGGWSPQPGVDLGTWLTSLVTLSLLAQNWQGPNRQRALTWLRNQIKPPEPPVVRAIAWMAGHPTQPLNRFGTSWYPGTAPWLYPTAITVLTLFHAERLTGDSSYGELARKGQEYILSRRCHDGGWNHGGAPYLDERPFSYPEMTGLALLALGGIPPQELGRSIQRAQSFLVDPASGEGLSWLQMGLAKHGIEHGMPAQPPAAAFPCRNPRDISLRLLALTANEARNFLVSAHSL